MKKIPLHSHDIIDKNSNPAQEEKYCCFHSCLQQGSYPAPKPRPHIRDRYWFCLEHVRRYNASWNYFSGMSMDQVEQYQQGAVLGHRPTWKMGVPPAPTIEHILDKVFTLFDGADTAASSAPTLPATEREALAVLDLSYPVTLQEIKTRYKKLVKRYHPDVNNTDNNAQDKFIAVNKAYTLLIDSGYFLP